MSVVTSGWLGQPISHRVGMRRSTAILLVVFVGLGLLYLEVRTPLPSVAVVPNTTTVPRAELVPSSTTTVTPKPTSPPTTEPLTTSPLTTPPLTTTPLTTPPSSTDLVPADKPGGSTTPSSVEPPTSVS